MNLLTSAFGPTRYAVPREGSHGTINCWFGKHWWTLVRRERDGLPLAVACAVCRKVLKVHDLGPDFGNLGHDHQWSDFTLTCLVEGCTATRKQGEQR